MKSILQVARDIIESTEGEEITLKPEKLLFCVGPGLFYEVDIED